VVFPETSRAGATFLGAVNFEQIRHKLPVVSMGYTQISGRLSVAAWGIFRDSLASAHLRAHVAEDRETQK
jgi:hypothetical protein